MVKAPAPRSRTFRSRDETHTANATPTVRTAVACIIATRHAIDTRPHASVRVVSFIPVASSARRIFPKPQEHTDDMSLKATIHQSLKPGLLRPALIALFSAATAFAFNAPAQQAQPAPGQGAPQSQQSGPMAQLQAKRQEIQQLNQQLVKIQEATMEANPELAKKRDNLMDLVDTKMQEAGHEPEAHRDELEALQQKLSSDDLSEEERQSVTQQLRQKQRSLQQAQSQIMQEEEVSKQRESLNEALVDAMKEQNPKAEQLIADLQQAQQEYQSILQQAMQQRQQQGGGAPQSR